MSGLQQLNGMKGNKMFRFSPEAQARIDANRAFADEKRRTFSMLRNDELVATAKFYMAQMTPLAFAPGEPVYDATMWNIILPELLKRLEAK